MHNIDRLWTESVNLRERVTRLEAAQSGATRSAVTTRRRPIAAAAE